MNERIRELVQQSGMELKPRQPYDEENLPGYVVSDMDYFDDNLEAVRAFFDGGLEKFAELIVKDCLAKLLSLKEGYDDPGTYESTEYYQRMEAKSLAMEEAIDEIKYRFEVKS
jgi:hypothetical protein